VRGEIKMAKPKRYDPEYIKQAIKLAKEIGATKAGKELGISDNTIRTWLKKEKSGYIDLGQGSRTPENVMTLAEENQQLRIAIKKLEKENRELKETNEFLEEASAFFAASRQKLRKAKE